MPAMSDMQPDSKYQKLAHILRQSKKGNIPTGQAVASLMTVITSAAPAFFKPNTSALQAHLGRLHSIYMADLLELEDACEDISRIIDAALRDDIESLPWLKMA